MMPFVGDDLALSARLQRTVIQEVENMAEYSTRSVSSTEFPETLGFRPDEPPDPWYPGDIPYVLTGEFYYDTEGLQHFQLWLWNSDDGSLVYTDELVAEDTEEAESYLPPLVSWVFSKIPKAQELRVAVDLQGALDVQGTVEEVMAERRRTDEQAGLDSGERAFSPFYLGMQAGASMSAFYARTTENFDAGMSQGFGLGASFLLGYRPWRFFSIQLEAIFCLDSFKVFSIERSTNEILHTATPYTSMSVLFPLLLRLPFEEGKFSFSVLGGLYFILPLGQTVDQNASYAYQMDLPLGVMAGADLGYILGPGEIFVSLRYGHDLGLTIVHSGLQYSQARVQFSIGYRFDIFKKKESANRRVMSLTGTGQASGSGTGSSRIDAAAEGGTGAEAAADAETGTAAESGTGTEAAAGAVAEGTAGG